MHTQIKKDIIALAKENPNEEICGLLYYTFHDLKLYKCNNIENNKTEDFQIDHKEYLDCLKLGTPCGIYHSHCIPDTTAFTQSDLDLAEEMALPIYVYGVKDEKFQGFIPKSYQLLLEGLPYIWGTFDCYEIIRIYFRQKYNIYMNDYDRDSSYIYDERDVITENFEKEGFIKINSPIKKDDVLVFSSTLARPQHFIIFLGNSRGLHHPLGKLSRIETIQDYSKLKYILRYKGNL